MKTVLKELKKTFSIDSVLQQKDRTWFITVQREHAVPLLNHLQSIQGFTHLSLLTAVDRIEDNRFELAYILFNHYEKVTLGVNVLIDRDNPVMDSVHHLWRHAATHQRELNEMFGISFPQSPRNSESFILEGWDSMPPMRRDFDTKEYAEDRFFPRPGRTTNDPASFMKDKLYPEGE